jgi:hypothetical protein
MRLKCKRATVWGWRSEGRKGEESWGDRYTYAIDIDIDEVSIVKLTEHCLEKVE